MKNMNAVRMIAAACLMTAVAAADGAAQNQRVVLIEDFSSVTCSNCPRASEIVHDVVSDNKTALVSIQYHLNIPGKNDPFYEQNKADNDTRSGYYGGLNALPQMFVNGIATEPTNQSAVESDVSSELSQGDPALKFTVTQTREGSSFNVKIVVDAEESLPVGFNLYAAAVEGLVERSSKYFTDTAKSVPYIGETKFYDLFRKFISPSAGVELDLGQGESETFNWSYQLGDRWNGDDMYVVVWVQDEFSRQIVQAGFSPKPASLGVTEHHAVAGYALESIAPNPAIDNARLNFTLAHAENVAVGVYSATGELVKTAELGMFGAGTHSTDLDLEGLPAGAYRVTVKAGDFQASESMTVLK